MLLLARNHNNAIKQVSYSFNLNSKIKTNRILLSKYPEQGYVTIVRFDTDRALKIDASYADVIVQMRKYMKVADIVDKTNKTFGEIEDLILSLFENNFIEKIDEFVLFDNSEKIKPWFSNLNLNILTRVLNLRVYLVIIVVCFLIIIGSVFYTHLIPSFDSFFWHHDLFISFVSVFLFGLYFAAFHEAAHFLTTIVIGGKARINFVKNRSLFLVYETESYHIAVAKKSERIAVYISGITVDLVQIALAYLLLDLNFSNVYFDSFFQNAILLFILTGVLGILWQCNIYVKTDMFNVVEELLNQSNLYEDTKCYMVDRLADSKNILLRKLYKILKPFINLKSIKFEADNLTEMSMDDKVLIERYSILVFFGGLSSIVILILFVFRRDAEFLLQAIVRLIILIPEYNLFSIFKEVLIISMIILYYLLLGLSLFRSLKHKKMRNKLLTRSVNN